MKQVGGNAVMGDLEGMVGEKIDTWKKILFVCLKYKQY